MSFEIRDLVAELGDLATLGNELGRETSQR
jgi:hypothetical protein